MTTVFVKVLTPPKAYTSKLGHAMFRVMVAVKDDKSGYPLIGSQARIEEFPVNRFLTLTKCSKGDKGISLSAETVVSNLLH